MTAARLTHIKILPGLDLKIKRAAHIKAAVDTSELPLLPQNTQNIVMHSDNYWTLPHYMGK